MKRLYSSRIGKLNARGLAVSKELHTAIVKIFQKYPDVDYRDLENQIVHTASYVGALSNLHREMDKRDARRKKS